MAGRIISASHVAFGSSRVMATGAHGAQAVAVAAKLCLDQSLLPRDLIAPDRMHALQQELLKTGQYIPGISLNDPANLAAQAQISASSELIIRQLPPNGPNLTLGMGAAQMLPFGAGKVPVISLTLEALEPTVLEVSIRISSRTGNFSPDHILNKKHISLKKGVQTIALEFDAELAAAQYGFICFGKNTSVLLSYSDFRATGILSVFNSINEAVSNYGKQTPPEDIGMEEFEFWCPQRRPNGHNLALTLEPGLPIGAANQVINGLSRPILAPNAWIADPADPAPSLTLSWDQPQALRTVQLKFDTDFDHPMESVLMTHPETVMPFCVRAYTLFDDKGQALHTETANHQSINHIYFPEAVTTASLRIEFDHPGTHTPASVFEILCYS